MKKMWYVYTMEYYLAIQKKEVLPFAATWMQLEILMKLSAEVRQISDDITHTWNLKYGTKAVLYSRIGS